MGAEILVPLALSAAASGAGALNTARTQRRQDAVLAQNIRQQAARQRQADVRVDEEIARVRGSDPQSERAAAMDQYMQSLQASRAGAANPALTGASGRFVNDAAANAAAVQSNAARVADLMSRINAPGLQRQREAQGMAQLGSDLGTFQRLSAGDDFINQLRARSIRANPWVNAGIAGLQGLAGGLASRDPTSKLPQWGRDVTYPWDIKPTLDPDKLPPVLVMNTGGLA